MLTVDGLVKSFDGKPAVDGISFVLEKGDVLGFLGPNGAGKSTTMRMVAGVLLPDRGDVSITGHSILSARQKAQGALGYLPEGAPLYPDLTPLEFLGFLASVRALPKQDRKDAIDRVIADARISSVARKPIQALSKGYRRRVGLAGTLLHDPPVLVLDEPTDGLDPHQKQAVRALISRMAREKAILISTHTLEEVPAMCNRVLIVDRGRIVADGTPDSLSEGRTLERAFLDLTDHAEAA
ncbi:MAG: ABC transporter ATP-binding protein [Pseudomonadota bacterium]